jgi:uncharacterized protein (TIGR00304 family)
MKIIRIGISLILIGFLLLLIGTILSTINGAQNVNFGFFGMIGPIPIGFGSSPEITIISMAMGLFMMILYFIIGRRNA